MSLGSLKVLLGLDAAEFTSGLTKAEERLKRTERQAQNFGRTLSNSVAVGVAKAAVALTVLDRAGGFLIRMGFDAINTAASFQDMSEKTGASAEALASFQTAASVTNTSMETLANLSVKLTKGLAGTDEETKQAANAIKQLGFNVDEFKKLDPAAQFEAIGKRLNEFGDGAGKTAFAVAALGRSGADALPFLKELGEQGKRNVILTAAQIKIADDFVDAQARATSELKQYLQVAGVQALEALTPLTVAFKELIKQIVGVSDVSNSLAGNKGISDWAKSAAQSIAFVVDAIDGFIRAGNTLQTLVRGLENLGKTPINRLGTIKDQLKDIGKQVDDILLPETFGQKLDRAFTQQGSAANAFEANFPASEKPKLDARRFGGGGGASAAASKAAQEQKKLLDKQLSDIDNFIKAEKRIFETRESDLARLYQNDQISISAYFDERLAALNQNTTATVDLYNKQIQAQEAFAAAAKKRKDEPASIDAQKQIGDIQARIEDVLHDKRQRSLKLEDERKQSARDYADQVSEVRARVLELLGTEEAALQAAKLRFDIQNRPAIQAAQREQNPALAADIAALRAQSDAQTKINNLLKDAGVIEQNLATAQAKLHLERDLGMRDEIDTLGLVGRASGEAAAKLKLIADQYLAIAIASKDPQIIANALALKQRVDELAAATDILAAKIRQTFVDTGASAIETFLNSMAEGKNALDSFKAAFTQFANDIIRQINRIAAQKIADSLFKGGSGGDGGIFGSIADAFVSYVGGISGREKGGLVSGQTPYVVGERGPEIFVPQTVAAAATKQIDSLIAQRGRPVEYTDHVRAVATNLPHLIGAKGPEIFVPKVDGIVIPNNKVAKLSAVLERRATAEVTRRREISAPLAATRTILRDEKITTRYANAPYSRRATGGPVTAHVPYVVGEQGREIFLPKSAKAIQRSKQAVADLVASAPLQRRSSGGAVEGSTSYVVGELGPELFMPQSAARIINNEIVHNDRVASNTRNEKIINQFVSNIQRKSFAGGPAQAEKIIKNENSVSVVTTNARRNEKVINDLISKTVQHHAETNDKIINRLGTTTRTNEPPIVEARRFIPKVADRIIKSTQRINDLVSNIEHRNIDRRSEKHIDEIISSVMRRRAIENQTAAASIVGNRGREIFIPKSVLVQKKRLAPELPSAAFGHIVGEFGPEIFVPKTAGRIIKNERAIDVLVANASHQKSHGVRDVIYRDKADGIKVPSDFFTNQQYHRANGGVVAANQPYLVGERGAEAFVPKNRVFASGTDFVPRDGPAYLHRGERVVTADDNKNGRWNKGDTNINITVPGGTNQATANQIAAAVSRQMAISNARYN